MIILSALDDLQSILTIPATDKVPTKIIKINNSTKFPGVQKNQASLSLAPAPQSKLHTTN